MMEFVGYLFVVYLLWQWMESTNNYNEGECMGCNRCSNIEDSQGDWLEFEKMAILRREVRYFKRSAEDTILVVTHRDESPIDTGTSWDGINEYAPG